MSATDTTTAKHHVVLRWDIFDGHYFVGPFTDRDAAAAWGKKNEGTVNWQLEFLDTTRALEVRTPRDMPFVERQSDTGAFYSLMIDSDPLHLVGPFPDHHHAYSWALAYQLRTDDEGWQIIWLEDPSTPARLLTPAEGEREAARSVEESRREQEV